MARAAPRLALRMQPSAAASGPRRHASGLAAAGTLLQVDLKARLGWAQEVMPRAVVAAGKAMARRAAAPGEAAVAADAAALPLAPSPRTVACAAVLQAASAVLSAQGHPMARRGPQELAVPGSPSSEQLLCLRAALLPDGLCDGSPQQQAAAILASLAARAAVRGPSRSLPPADAAGLSSARELVATAAAAADRAAASRADWAVPGSDAGGVSGAGGRLSGSTRAARSGLRFASWSAEARRKPAAEERASWAPLLHWGACAAEACPSLRRGLATTLVSLSSRVHAVRGGEAGRAHSEAAMVAAAEEAAAAAAASVALRGVGEWTRRADPLLRLRDPALEAAATAAARAAVATGWLMRQRGGGAGVGSGSLQAAADAARALAAAKASGPAGALAGAVLAACEGRLGAAEWTHAETEALYRAGTSAAAAVAAAEAGAVSRARAAVGPRARDDGRPAGSGWRRPRDGRALGAPPAGGPERGRAWGDGEDDGGLRSVTGYNAGSAGDEASDDDFDDEAGGGGWWEGGDTAPEGDDGGDGGDDDGDPLSDGDAPGRAGWHVATPRERREAMASRAEQALPPLAAVRRAARWFLRLCRADSRAWSSGTGGAGAPLAGSSAGRGGARLKLWLSRSAGHALAVLDAAAGMGAVATLPLPLGSPADADPAPPLGGILGSSWHAAAAAHRGDWLVIRQHRLGSISGPSGRADWSVDLPLALSQAGAGDRATRLLRASLRRAASGVLRRVPALTRVVAEAGAGGQGSHALYGARGAPPPGRGAVGSRVPTAADAGAASAVLRGALRALVGAVPPGPAVVSRSRAPGPDAPLYAWPAATAAATSLLARVDGPPAPDALLDVPTAAALGRVAALSAHAHRIILSEPVPARSFGRAAPSPLTSQVPARWALAPPPLSLEEVGRAARLVSASALHACSAAQVCADGRSDGTDAGAHLSEEEDGLDGGAGSDTDRSAGAARSPAADQPAVGAAAHLAAGLAPLCSAIAGVAPCVSTAASAAAARSPAALIGAASALPQARVSRVRAQSEAALMACAQSAAALAAPLARCDRRALAALPRDDSLALVAALAQASLSLGSAAKAAASGSGQAAYRLRTALRASRGDMLHAAGALARALSPGLAAECEAHLLLHEASAVERRAYEAGVASAIAMRQRDVAERSRNTATGELAAALQRGAERLLGEEGRALRRRHAQLAAGRDPFDERSAPGDGSAGGSAPAAPRPKRFAGRGAALPDADWEADVGHGGAGPGSPADHNDGPVAEAGAAGSTPAAEASARTGPPEGEAGDASDAWLAVADAARTAPRGRMRSLHRVVAAAGELEAEAFESAAMLPSHDRPPCARGPSLWSQRAIAASGGPLAVAQAAARRDQAAGAALAVLAGTLPSPAASAHRGAPGAAMTASGVRVAPAMLPATAPPPGRAPLEALARLAPVLALNGAGVWPDASERDAVRAAAVLALSAASLSRRACGSASSAAVAEAVPLALKALLRPAVPPVRRSDAAAGRGGGGPQARNPAAELGSARHSAIAETALAVALEQLEAFRSRTRSG